MIKSLYILFALTLSPISHAAGGEESPPKNVTVRVKVSAPVIAGFPSEEAGAVYGSGSLGFSPAERTVEEDLRAEETKEGAEFNAEEAGAVYKAESGSGDLFSCCGSTEEDVRKGEIEKGTARKAKHRRTYTPPTPGCVRNGSEYTDTSGSELTSEEDRGLTEGFVVHPSGFLSGLPVGVTGRTPDRRRVLAQHIDPTPEESLGGRRSPIDITDKHYNSKKWEVVFDATEGVHIIRRSTSRTGVSFFEAQKICYKYNTEVPTGVFLPDDSAGQDPFTFRLLNPLA